MANVLKPKRSNTANKVPVAGTDLVSGEIGVNMADKKIYIHNGTAVVQVGAGTLAALSDTTIATPASGEVLQYDGSAWVNAAASSSALIFTGFDGGTASTSVYDLTLDLGAS